MQYTFNVKAVKLTISAHAFTIVNSGKSLLVSTFEAPSSSLGATSSSLGATSSSLGATSSSLGATSSSLGATSSSLVETHSSEFSENESEEIVFLKPEDEHLAQIY